jgi:hypothetical protein
MSVKLFWKNEPLKPGSGLLRMGRTGGHAVELEQEINQWLARHPNIRVVEIKQSASGGSFADSLWLILIWYEEQS